MNITTVLNQVFILFIILLIGFVSRRKGILNHETNRKLTDFLLNVTIPFTIISSFNQDYPKNALYSAGLVFVFSFLIHLFSILIGRLLYMKFESSSKKILWFVTVFSNCGFMGFPVLESIYGKIGVLYGSVYVIAFNIFIWTFGQMLFSGKKDLSAIKTAILNPGIIAVFIGTLVFLSPVKTPFFLSRVIDLMGSLTTPLSMIIVGSMLAEVRLRELFSGYHIYYGTAVRLIVMPALTLLSLKALGIHGSLLGVCVISAAMPAAANTVMFAEKFNGDSLLASRFVFFSTAASIITIPVVLLFL